MLLARPYESGVVVVGAVGVAERPAGPGGLGEPEGVAALDVEVAAVVDGGAASSWHRHGQDLREEQ